MPPIAAPRRTRPSASSGITAEDPVVGRAAEWLHSGRRLDMRLLAEDLGMSRATLFRRVGHRERLLSDAMWVLTEHTLRIAAHRWEAERPKRARHTPGTGRHFNAILSRAPGLRRLLDEEPAAALRVLTDPRGQVQTGTVAFFAALIERDVAEFRLKLLIEPDALAYALVRLGESFVYADLLAARQPDVDAANQLQQVLFDGVQIKGRT
jgi:tetracycline repressor-like protein